MAFPRRFLIALLCFGAPSAAGAGEGTPRHLCPENAPDGVRLPPRTGCGAPRPQPETAERRGWRTIDGVTLRIGGRVGAEYGIGR